MKNFFSLKKIVSSLLIVSIAATQILSVPVAHAGTAHAATARAASPVYDLVALAVDTELDQDNTSYLGLQDDGFGDELSDDKLGHRIIRYAEDLRANNELTDVKILYFDKEEDTVIDIANALENLYRNGDGTHNNRLAGAVFIGDIPLPVVNKNGNRYISMFPYTDFSEKAYIYNPETKNFEQNSELAFPKPEIWHGVIRAPTNDSEGKEKLAEFFDKNHLYYEGEPMFANFDRKMFFGDLLHEEEQINEDIYKFYVKYLENFEDLAYMRYNKFWASELTKGVVEELPFNEDNPSNQGESGFAQTLQSDNPLANLPDIYSKQIIDNALLPYFKIFSSYFAKINDWADYTGRYQASSDFHSVPGLISMKDEYTKFYLKSVNDALEKKINDIAEMIQEPLPILEVSELTGEYEDTDFYITLPGAEGEDNVASEVDIRFHYKNEEDSKFYINGIRSNELESAKQCAPYLGSTKSSYFDEDLNYNPKAFDGEYSILTRAMRSDNIMTALPTVTTGVNTRMLAPEELFTKTGGAYTGRVNIQGVFEGGAIIEDNKEYGVPPFIDNPFYHRGGDDRYEGPFETKLQTGDVIVAVNGRNLTPEYTFDRAIRKSYDYVLKVMSAVNDENLESLENFEYPIVLNSPITVVNSVNEMRVHPEVDDADIEVAAGIISVDFYRGSSRMIETFTFAVEDDDGLQFTSREDPQGDPEILIVFADNNLADFEGLDFDEDTEGAIFTLYANDELGYDDRAYDNSAGCNARSTSKNSDRCFPFAATMPVLDPAGAQSIVKTEVPGLGDYLMFPEKIKRDSQGRNSPVASDYYEHVYHFQFPNGYQYEDVDEMYYNYCYWGLPADSAGLFQDENPYKFVLDPGTKPPDLPAPGPGDPAEIDDTVYTDFYGRLLKSIGDFVADDATGNLDNLSDQLDFVDMDEEDEVDDNPNYIAAIRDYNPAVDLWLGFANLKAEDVVLNNHFDPVITLGDFAKRYGMFDGLDNDNDEITDYKWVPRKGHEGEYDKFFDYDEADERYGIADAPFPEVARKMLSHESTFRIPYDRASFPYDDFDEELVLEVDPSQLGTIEVSSVIIHNEPTPYTISEQLKSGTALSLPIDNPRYVAFQSLPWEGPEFPGIALPGATLPPYYAPGKINKIEYINLFAEDVTNSAQLQSKLIQKANEIALIPGSYRIFGPDATARDYSLIQISNKILNDYLIPAVNSALDDPLDGFDLVTASTEKIYDALYWKILDIDNKHEYVLKYYLNGDEDTNAFVNDASLFPAPFGYEPSYGYEAAYLVLDGEDNYFNTRFNKDLPKEDDLAFDPLTQSIEASDEVESSTDEEGGGDEGMFVWIWEFIEELTRFVTEFSVEVSWAQACGSLPDFMDDFGIPEPGGVSALPLADLALEVSSDVVTANGTDTLTVVVTGLDGNGAIAAEAGNEIITLNVAQNNAVPILEFRDTNPQTLSGGVITYSLQTTENEGTVNISASSGSGFSSNVIQVTSTGGYVDLYSYTYLEIEGATDLLELEEAAAAGTGAGLEGLGSEIVGGSETGGDSGVLVSEEIVGGTGGGSEGGISGGASGDDDGGGDDDDNNGGDDDDGGDGGANDAAKAVIRGSSSNYSVEDLENILTALSRGDGDGENGAGGGEDSAGVVDEKNLTILVSKPVEEAGGEETVGSEVKEEMKETEPEKAEEKIKEPEIEDFEDLQWEKYYVEEQYYKKYLNEITDKVPEVSTRRLFAEIASDRMLALIPNSKDSRYIIEGGDEFVANGESLMKIEAVIVGNDGNVQVDRDYEIKFAVEDESVGIPPEQIVTFENDDTIRTKDGKAVVYLRAGTKIGKFKIIANVVDSSGRINRSFAPMSKDLYLVADEPVTIDITSDSYVLVANNQSKTTVNFTLKDKFGNTANNSFAKIAVFVSGAAELDPGVDENSQILGTQLSTLEGKTSATLLSKDEAGEVNVIALIMNYELEESFLDAGDDWEQIDFSNELGNSHIFNVFEDVGLEFELQDSRFAPATSVLADGKSIGKIGVKMMHDGQVVEDYNGEINFRILNENFGKFVNEPPKKMIRGKLNPANITFRSSTLTGEAEILVDVPGFTSDVFKFDTTAGTPKKIELIASDDFVYTDGENHVVLRARLLDKFDNLVDTNTGTRIRFGTTEATDGTVEFSPTAALTLNGVASTTIYGSTESGIANIVAEAEGIENGILSMTVTKHLTNEDIEGFSPRALYVSLLGGSFGKINVENNLAQTFLNNGQVQAVSTITASPSDKKRLFGVDGYGKIERMSDTVSITVSPAVKSFPYQKLIFSDSVENKELANMFVVPQVDTPLVLLEEEEDGGEKEMSGELIPIPDEEGIYVQKLVLDEKFVFEEKDDGIYINRGNDNKAKIDEFGRIFLNDDKYDLNVPEGLGLADFSLMMVENEEPIALITFRQNFEKDVEGISYKSPLTSFFPGIYIQPKFVSSKYDFVRAFTRASTKEPQGFYLVDTKNDIDDIHVPGFGFDSLEDARDRFGLGFGSNKHMLLFAAGNSVGESLIHYASDTGIVYGDPMIRLKVDDDLVSELTGYSKDIGQPLFTGTDTITELIDFDFNGDGLNDLLLVYENGLIRLLENEVSNKRFFDRGYILNVSTGIWSTTKIDVNNDGYDDLIIGTKESCNAGEECITQYINRNGHFIRETLNLNLNGKKAVEINAGDLNADGCEDLVLSDSAGQINIFYNQLDGRQCTGINPIRGFLKSYGISVNSGANLVNSLYIYYSGMEVPNEGEKDYLLDNGEDDDNDGIIDDVSNLYKFIQFNLPSSEAPEEITGENTDPRFSSSSYAEAGDALQAQILSNENIASNETPPRTYPHEFNFINISEDNTFDRTSSKEAIDVNAGAVAIGDTINYLVLLKNNSTRAVRNLMLSDTTPAAMRLNLESLQCLDAGCDDNLEWVSTGLSLRSYIITGISVPANGQRIIKYSMNVDMVPSIHFDIGNDFADYPSAAHDNYLDILVRPEVNPEGILTYLYSTGLDSRGYVEYEEYEFLPGEDGSESLLGNSFKEKGLPSPSDLLEHDPESEEVDPALTEGIGDLMNNQNQDADYDGCSDLWDGSVVKVGHPLDAASAIAGKMEGAMNALRCSGGGCLPIPYNKAFLVPDGMIPGFAPVNIVSYLPFWVPFGPSQDPGSQFRFYVSPTLTMGVGMAACAGTGAGHLSPCFAFALPGGMPGACSAIEGGLDKINEGIAKAKNAVVDFASGQSAIISDGETTNTANDIMIEGDTYGVGTSIPLSTDPDSELPIEATAKVNIKIPGFPSVITNWLDKQTDEIYDKLLSLPTVYFISPDFGELGNKFKAAGESFTVGDEFSWQSFNDFATSISNIPFIQIEGKEVIFRVPAISKKEAYKWSKEMREKWVQREREELERFTAVNCEFVDTDPERRNLCDKILLDMNNLINSIQRLADLVDQIANLPRDILNWRYLEAKYASQLICYMDMIMQVVGGYINRQTLIIESWMQTIQQVIRAFRSWRAILDLILEYQTSCDKCMNDRFSKLALLLQLFVAIPEPPIIPFPKLPDIVVDVSQIKTGLKIVWPDIIFKPQPIILPDIPFFTLPDLVPGLTITIPGFPVPEIPDLILPNLPDLPPIPIPDLPDLPRPPHIPNIPNLVVSLLGNLELIFKILCLLKNGLIPVPEGFLATEIETLTQPSVKAVLPIIKNLSVQIPPVQYEFVREIRVTAKLGFDIDANFVYSLVKAGTDFWNEKVKLLINKINKYTRLDYGFVISAAIQRAIDEAYAAAARELEEAVSESGALPDSVIDAVDVTEPSGVPRNESSLLLTGNMTQISDAIENFSKEIGVSYSPDIYYLTATQTYLDPSDPLLNRTIEEVELDIQKQNLPDIPALRQMAEVRNELIAYTKNLNNSNALLREIEDYDSFTKILVENDQSLRKIAELSTATDVNTDGGAEKTVTQSFSLLGEAVQEIVFEAAEETTKSTRLLASATNPTPSEEVENAASAAPPIGFYVAKGDLNENVLNYTRELNGTTNVIFNDVDDDNDFDIVYSMGGDVYLKKNHENSPRLPRGNVIIGFINNSINDFVKPGGFSVQGLATPYVSNGKTTISWNGIPDALAYEVLLRHSLNDDFGDAAYNYLALPNPITGDESIAILDELGISADAEFVIELSNKSNPSIPLEVENGTYYVTVQAVNASGEASIISDVGITAPETCTDKEAPFPVVSATEYDVSIFKQLEIDASNSFDTDGKVKEYYLEVLPYVNEEGKAITALPSVIWSDNDVNLDTNKDGNPANDKSNPRFRIGPFMNEGDIGNHEMILHVKDQSGNTSSQNIKINVFVPDITLDPTFARTSIATGETEPSVAEMPFALMRQRFISRVIADELKFVPRLDIVREKETDGDGAYKISDFELEDMILVEDADGEIVAEIHPETGNIGALAVGHTARVNEAKIPNSPTSVDILDPIGTVLGSVFVIADTNTDVKIMNGFGNSVEDFAELDGVNVSDINLEDEFEWKQIPANDSSNPGGAILIRGDDSLLIIDTAGNIIILDEHVTISQKQNDHTTDPLIILVKFGGVDIGEIYISTLGSLTQILARPDVPFATPRSPSASTLYKSFGENFAEDLLRKGIISTGISPEQLVTRLEFVKVLLDMLCIIPREEAYEPYEPSSAYSDIPYKNDENFAYIKEGTLLGLVEGYKGEPNEAGLIPFKPNKTINRAEATKIILEALEMQGVIDLSGITEGEPWYDPYMSVAQNLNPYFKDGVLIQNNFIVTPEEAAYAEEIMNFEGLMEMVTRVLDIYNCFEFDSDGDSMPDVCEKKYGIDDAAGDADNDELNNADECYFGSDPFDQDTDKGGVWDGAEMRLGTNILDPLDDPADDDGDGLLNAAEVLVHGTDPNNPDTDSGGVSDFDEVNNLSDPLDAIDDGSAAVYQEGEEGIYIVPPDCNTCPCVSTFLHKAEVIPGDIFFPVISANNHILSKGNEVIKN